MWEKARSKGTLHVCPQHQACYRTAAQLHISHLAPIAPMCQDKYLQSNASLNHYCHFDLQDFNDTWDNTRRFLRKDIESLAMSIHVKIMMLFKTAIYLTHFKV